MLRASRWFGFALVVFASCGLPEGVKNACTQDSDCNSGRVCAQGVCIAASSASAGASSGGTASGGVGGISGMGGAPSMGGSASASGAAGSGTAGSQAIAGDMNSAGASGCGNDTECDDGDPCDGIEHCVLHSCASGMPACADAGAACVVTCENVHGVAECSTVGADSDKDGYKSAACAAAPGDDCDDTRATVHPYARELCDGLDNDCDGKVDLEDGLSLSGITKEWDGESGGVDVVWAPDKQVYGATWINSNGAARVLFSTVTNDGLPGYSQPITIFPQQGGTSTLDISYPRVARGGSSWAITYVTKVQQGHLQRVDDSGALLGSGAVLSGNSLTSAWPIVRADTGPWLVFQPCCVGSKTNASPVSDADQVGISNLLPGALSAVGTAGDQIAAAWLGFPAELSDAGALVSHENIQWSRRAADLTPIGSVQTLADVVTDNGAKLEEPAFAGNGTGYAIAWRQIDQHGLKSLQYAELSRDGSVTCGPVDVLAPTPDAGTVFEPVAMSGNASGYVMISSGQDKNSSYVIEGIHVRAGCQFVQRFEIARSTTDKLVEASIARSPQGHLVFWRDTNAQVEDSSWVRPFGPNLCD